MAVLQSFLGASLAEFISSYPTEGAMYHWIGAIAPRRTTGFLSFVTGWLTVAGCTWIWSEFDDDNDTDLLRDFHYGFHESYLCSELHGPYCSVSWQLGHQNVDDFRGIPGLEFGYRWHSRICKFCNSCPEQVFSYVY